MELIKGIRENKSGLERNLREDDSNKGLSTRRDCITTFLDNGGR
jgi:hypothetical protein